MFVVLVLIFVLAFWCCSLYVTNMVTKTMAMVLVFMVFGLEKRGNISGIQLAMLYSVHVMTM